MRINPFYPNTPVNHYCFHGRQEEQRRINNILFQTKNARLTNFLITGERGIGKSSLLLYTKFLASGGAREIATQFDLNYFTIQISLDRNTTLIQLAKKINAELSRCLKRDDKLKNIIGSCWDFIKQLEVKGFKFNEKIADPDELNDHLIYSLIDSARGIVESGYDGILILIDEADNASKAELGSFIKNLSEKLILEDFPRIIIGLAGLPKITENLFKDHKSVLRVFEILELETLNRFDVRKILDQAERSASEKNGEKIEITDAAKDSIYRFSEGYPHFVQQIGASCFDFLKGSEKRISNEMVEKVMFMPKGALHKIGQSYYYEMYWNGVKDDKYREVLQIMAEIGYNKWVEKREIQKKFSGTASVLTSALSALTDRKIILRDSSRRGQYRLHSIAYAIWIKKFGTKEYKNTFY